MEVILYMAISANGMIAKSDDDTSWISKEEWDSYSLAVRSAGCLVVGRRTYHILTEQPEFTEFKDIKLAVVSKEDFATLAPNHLVAHSPKEALELLKDFKKVIVAGGGILNASFLVENLIDEIYLDIEPIIFGDGIPVFQDKNCERRLKLIGQKKITDAVIQLHYEVLK
ncbi:dihydrofolate reductase [Candidatus Daviesbacteria bacterium]|nr:dihydrofolate reductase [Candidatus Daviesbacteria bacterium]